ncbi:MAG: substrate-binding domain-containing protein [Fimbriimonadaceae bacterium]
MMNWKFAGLLAMGLVMAGCGKGGDTASEGTAGAEKPLVVFAQANSADPWRQVFDAEMKAEAEKYASEFTFESQAAEDNAQKQMNVVDTFLVKEPKVLLISPVDASLRPAIEKAYDQKIPVILLDRAIEGDKFTAWIGGDNQEIGRQAGEYLVKKLGGKGTILMIRGIAAATPTLERGGGAMEVFAKYPGIKVIEGDDCGYQREKARKYMETFLQKGQKIDAIYAHNDEMAIGAYLAWEAANPSTEDGNPVVGSDIRPIIVGIDACQVEIVDFIKQGKIDATFKYPNPGPKGIQVAADILKGGMPANKKIVLPTERVDKDNADAYLAANPKLHK